MKRLLIATAATIALAAAPTASAAPIEIETIALSGDPAPSAGRAVLGNFRGPRPNEAGQVAFGNFLVTNGEVTSDDEALLLADVGSGDTRLLFRAGDAVPGIAGANFIFFDALGVSEAGQVTFFSAFEGAGVDGDDNVAVFRYDPTTDETTQIVRAGDVAVGVGGRAFFGFNGLRTNDRGQVTFVSSTVGSGQGLADRVGGVFRYDGTADGNVLIVRDGDEAVGTGGAAFDRLFAGPDLNEAGRVAFGAGFGGAGVTSADDSGVFVYRAVLELIDGTSLEEIGEVVLVR